jgi:hypothetical protein
MTIYATKRLSKVSNSHRKRDFIKWILGLGAVILVAFAVKKSISNSAG